ncbi:MAG: hypothetical protein OEN23_03740 [Paracoccaceae bacterium]|nr:hypothetical protein [Paracoccaceae bacterium]
MTALLDEVTAEIVRLHDFFEGWFQGTLPQNALDTSLAPVLHPDFENIQPAGTVLTRAVLLGAIAKAHGTNPDFRIGIREPRLLGHWPDAGLILAGYVEAQFGARNTTPADNLRRSTVLFERLEERLIWRYVHETALPS